MFPSALPGTPGLNDADDATLNELIEHRLPGSMSMPVPQLRSLLKAATDQSNVLATTMGLV
jgi:hypothetical protein